MNTTSKIAIGLGVASGALLAAWLLTGSRKQKTKAFISRKAVNIKRNLQADKPKNTFEETETFYI